MKSIMISIRPEWCELIAKGIKKKDLRKTRPKEKGPYKCLIYCTESGVDLKKFSREKMDYIFLNGKVIGEFVCNQINAILPDNFIVKEDAERVLAGSCVSINAFKEYMGWKQGAYIWDCKDGYAWEISDLVIYETPKSLSDYNMKRPPQSWCYIKQNEV